VRDAALRAVPVLGEVVCAFVVAGLLTAAGARVQLDPETDGGRVSILAHMQLAATLVVIGLLLAVVVTARFWDGRLSAGTRRLTWASLTGLASGITAGGVAAMLNGTPWPLNAALGDSGRIMEWAYNSMTGAAPLPVEYPPGAIRSVIWTSQLLGLELAPSQKLLQIVGVAAIGPLAYLAWRTVLPPAWSCAVAVLSSAPYLDPYKPIPQIGLVVATPVLVCLVVLLRRAGTHTWASLVVRSLLLGGTLGLVFLSYSGWFVWCAPGVAVAGLLAFPWRDWVRGAVVAIGAVGAFLVVAGWYVAATLAGPPLRDDYLYFDTGTDPAYFAAWFGDLPGDVGAWPPFGELGGVSVFTLALLAGLGLALALGWRSWTVRTIALIFAGAWFLRFWIAREMATTGLVQLYPRTNQVLLYCALTCCALALCHGLSPLVRRQAAAERQVGSFPWSPAPIGWVVGALTTLALLAASVGSATVDKYMPANDATVAKFAWVALNPYDPRRVSAGPDGLVTVELTGEEAPRPRYEGYLCRMFLGQEPCPP
jgi:galactan 5-O-arabinofuranosyltransferase